jgi:hypothetical protein
MVESVDELLVTFVAIGTSSHSRNPCPQILGIFDKADIERGSARSAGI